MLMNIPTQLWINSNEDISLEESMMKPVTNQGNLGIKGGGGLWTSTYLDKENGSDWVQWSLANNFNCPVNNIWKGYLLEPKKNLRIYTIDSLEEMHMMFDKYGYEYLPLIQQEGIDFEKMSLEYDGIHLTENGQTVTRHGFNFFGDRTILKPEWQTKKMRNLYGWDVESIFHFRWNFKKIIPVELLIESTYESIE